MIRALRPVVAAAVAALALNAHAEVDQFLLLSDIDGESQDETYKDSIDVLAWSWNVAQSGTMHSGSGGGAGKASFADVSVVKYVDSSSVELYRHITEGRVLDHATLKNRKSGENPVVTEELAMYDVLVTSVGTGGSAGEDRLTENISLNFRSFCIKYTELRTDGGPGTEHEFCWDIAAGEACTKAQLRTLMGLPLAMSLPMDKLLRMNPICPDT